MSLPYSDPANPALPSPLFSDLAAARSDHLRANNNAIFTDLTYLNDLIAATVAVYSIDVSGGTASITIPDDALYYATIRLYGAPTVNKTLVFPTQVRSCRIINNCTGNYYSHFKTASGTGVYMAPGDIWDVYCDGANINPMRVSSPNVIEISGLPAIVMNPNSQTKIIGLSSANDVLGQWSSANQRFVVKNNGVLSVLLQGKFNSSTGQLYDNHQCSVRKNGVVVNPPCYVFVNGVAVNETTAYNAWPEMTLTMPVKAGDYIEFYCMSVVSIDTRLAVFYAKILQIS